MSQIIYLIGSLRNPEIPTIGRALRLAGYDVFDDWYSAGPIADDSWRDHEIAKGRSYLEALEGYHAWHVFHFDYRHLNRATAAVLILPCGKSGHIEFGYARGAGKRCYVLMPSNHDLTRWDVMYRFAHKVCPTIEEIIHAIRQTD